MHHAQGCQGQCNAVSHGEGRDSLDQRPAPTNDEKECEDEEQMIDAKQNVFEAQCGVGR